MKNIDRMKVSLIQQIQLMNIEDYEKLNSSLCEKIPYLYENGWRVVNTDAVFTCEKCKDIFGDCTYDARKYSDLCKVRFGLYAEVENDESTKENQV